MYFEGEIIAKIEVPTQNLPTKMEGSKAKLVWSISLIWSSVIVFLDIIH
jgi:hypothetical protein